MCGGRSCDEVPPVNETIKWLSSLPILMQISTVAKYIQLTTTQKFIAMTVQTTTMERFITRTTASYN